MEIYGETLSNAVCVTDFHEKRLVDRNAQGKKDLVNSRILSYLTDSGFYKKSERKSRQEIEKMVGRVENQLLMRSLPLRKKLKEALQKPLFPSRIEQNCSVRFFFTTSKNGVFLPSK